MKIDFICVLQVNKLLYNKGMEWFKEIHSIYVMKEGMH